MTWLYLMMTKDDEATKKIPSDFLVASLIDFCALAVVIISVLAS